MLLEMFLNELSLVPARDVATAQVWAERFVRTMVSATSRGVQRAIYVPEDYSGKPLATAYYWHDWLADRRVDVELRRYYRSLTTKSPFLRDQPVLESVFADIDCFIESDGSVGGESCVCGGWDCCQPSVGCDVGSSVACVRNPRNRGRRHHFAERKRSSCFNVRSRTGAVGVDSRSNSKHGLDWAGTLAPRWRIVPKTRVLRGRRGPDGSTAVTLPSERRARPVPFECILPFLAIWHIRSTCDRMYSQSGERINFAAIRERTYIHVPGRRISGFQLACEAGPVANLLCPLRWDGATVDRLCWRPSSHRQVPLTPPKDVGSPRQAVKLVEPGAERESWGSGYAGRGVGVFGSGPPSRPSRRCRDGLGKFQLPRLAAW